VNARKVVGVGPGYFSRGQPGARRPGDGRAAHRPGRHCSRRFNFSVAQAFFIGAPQHIPGFDDVLPHFPHLN
jgi:hypothetical protein